MSHGAWTMFPTMLLPSKGRVGAKPVTTVSPKPELLNVVSGVDSGIVNTRPSVRYGCRAAALQPCACGNREKEKQSIYCFYSLSLFLHVQGAYHPQVFPDRFKRLRVAPEARLVSAWDSRGVVIAPNLSYSAGGLGTRSTSLMNVADNEIIRTTLPHSDFRAPDCCGCLNGIVRGDQSDIVCRGVLAWRLKKRRFYAPFSNASLN